MDIYQKLVLSLGSNIGDRFSYLQQAINEINQEIGVISKKSSIYETPAWGFSSTPFYNCSIEVNTLLPAEKCLKKCLEIEKKLGRSRKKTNEYEARVIDIDILFYDDTILDTTSLTLPHPLLHKRGFVLIPLIEICPKSEHPIFKKKNKDFLNEVDVIGIKKILNLEL